MNTNLTNKVTRITDALAKRYDPEHDTAPGVPSVTFADFELIEAIQVLVMIVEDLQYQISTLQYMVSK